MEHPPANQKKKVVGKGAPQHSGWRPQVFRNVPLFGARAKCQPGPDDVRQGADRRAGDVGRTDGRRGRLNDPPGGCATEADLRQTHCPHLTSKKPSVTFPKACQTFPYPGSEGETQEIKTRKKCWTFFPALLEPQNPRIHESQGRGVQGQKSVSHSWKSKANQPPLDMVNSA